MDDPEVKTRVRRRISSPSRSQRNFQRCGKVAGWFGRRPVVWLSASSWSMELNSQLKLGSGWLSPFFSSTRVAKLLEMARVDRRSEPVRNMVHGVSVALRHGKRPKIWPLLTCLLRFDTYTSNTGSNWFSRFAS